MISANNDLTIDNLRRFIPLRDMSDPQLQVLLRAVDTRQARPGELLIKIGSRDNFSYLLLKGTVRLKAEDGKVMDLNTDHPSALSIWMIRSWHTLRWTASWCSMRSPCLCRRGVSR